MLEALEKLLILQDRDRRVALLKTELGGMAPLRQMIRSKTEASRATGEASRQQVLHLESDRKRLELEVEAKKAQIERYSIQQYQTKKNDEYRALAHEIQVAKDEIIKLDDAQIELMERAESAQKQAAEAARAADAEHQAAQRQLADLDAREANLKQELARTEAERGQLGRDVDPEVLDRYERLRRTKGERVIVGIDHAACGGCHVKLPAQILITCQAEQEIPSCPNCGRILYYTRDMSLVAAE